MLCCAVQYSVKSIFVLCAKMNSVEIITAWDSVVPVFLSCADILFMSYFSLIKEKKYKLLLVLMQKYINIQCIIRQCLQTIAMLHPRGQPIQTIGHVQHWVNAVRTHWYITHWFSEDDNKSICLQHSFVRNRLLLHSV